MRDRKQSTGSTLLLLRGRLPTLSLRWRLGLVSFGLLAILLVGLGALISVTEEQTLLRNQSLTLHDLARLALPGREGIGGGAPGMARMALLPTGQTPLQWVLHQRSLCSHLV